jgi:PAS domain S-box-containing protein
MARRRAASARIRPAQKTTKTQKGPKAHRRSARPGAVSRLRLRARQHAAIAALGEQALAGLPPAVLMDAAVRTLSEGLDAEFVKIFELTTDGAELILRAGVGWQQGLVGTYTMPVLSNTQADFTLSTDRPVIVTDAQRETRFGIAPILAQHGIVSGMSVVIRGREAPFGVLGVHSARRRRFSSDDASVLASAANILAMAIDRDRADSQLRESESRLRAFFDHSPSLMNLRSPDGRYLMINRHYEDVFGVLPRQVLGKTSMALHGGEHGHESQEAVLKVVRERRSMIYEEQTPIPHGIRTFLTTRFPIFSDDGAVAAVGTIAPDVTALREAQTELRHYRDLLEGVTDTIPVTIAYVDADGIYRWINRRGAERHGRARAAIVGKSMREIWGQRYWEDQLEPFVRRVLTGETVAYDRTLERPQGTTLQIETHLTPALGPDGRVEGFCVLTVDVTERTRTTQALARSVSMLQATLESTADGILVVDQAGRVTACNRQFARMWRIPDDLLAEGEDEPLLSFVLGQLREPRAFLDRVRELYSNPETESFDVLEFRDGRVFERYCKAQRIDSVPVGRVWSFRDVTERQRAREALQNANEDLEQRVAERTGQLEAAHREAETLSYSIAHDLRAPLRAISGYARILIHDMVNELPEGAAELLERIGVNAERMGTLIDALLGFGQLSRQPLQPSTVRLGEVVDDALGWMQGELAGRPIEIECEELGEVDADPALIRIALANLLSNAIKFTRGREPARIQIGRTSIGGETVYYVRDNGAGFDMRYANKLFGMFQRLHGHGRFEGSGVGLASVQQIVQRHGGRVWAESSEGAGATFYFTLQPS